MAETQQMDPNAWGPPLWDMLFTLAFRVPPDGVPRLVDLFVLLKRVIPCQHCRRSYNIYIEQVKPSSIRAHKADSAAMWLWTIHDMVNQKLGKIAINFEAVKKRHLTFSPLTSDLMMVDLLGLMALVIKPETVRQFATILLEVLVWCPTFRLPSVLTLSEGDFLGDLYASHVSLTSGGGGDPSNEAFQARLANAYA